MANTLRKFGQKSALSAEPASLGERAASNLEFIRQTIERSTHFTAVPGYGGILMGATAVAAAYIAAQQATARGWLMVWLTEGGLAVAIGLLAMWQKSKIAGESLVSVSARKFAAGFAAPLVCGVVLTVGFWRFGRYELMPAMWMLTYGAAVVSGGAFSVRAVPIMGWLFIAAGSIQLALPSGSGNAVMAVSFGLLHIIFGAIIAKRYGG